MPIYTFCCPFCGDVREEIMGAHDEHVLTCECGMDMNRHWQADMPAIHGDTVAGGVNYSGWDEGLGMHINGRAHRKREMEARGLVEYEPTPEVREMLYLHKDGASGSRTGRAEMDRVAMEAEDRRTAEIVDKVVGNEVKDHVTRYIKERS